MAESAVAAPKRMKPKLTIEEYLDFINTDKRLDLTTDQLNQIIDMHGFRKILKTHKSILVDVVNKMELMNPTRSTLQDDGISSDAMLSLDDVIKDLNELKWQECCITSIQTVNAVNHHQHACLDDGCSTGTTLSASSEKPPRKRRRKLRKLNQYGVGAVKEDVVSTGLNFGGGSETASCSSQSVVNWYPRQKRTVKYGNMSGDGNNGVVKFATVTAGVVPPSTAAAVILLDK